MDTVLSVIAALEGTTITKEQLEATRLAKYINQLRRRTKCENLARRAKSLLKKWREMVGIQQTNESSAAAGALVTSVINTTAATAASNSISTASIASFNMPVADNTVSTSYLANPQLTISHQQQHIQRQNQYLNNAKQCQIQQPPYHSQPNSPVNLQEKSNTNEYLISMSNPATGAHIPKNANTNVRKKKRLEKTQNYDKISPQQQQPQQPTSFANLLTGLGSTFASIKKTSRESVAPAAPAAKPMMETFIIEHSSNSNSDLICLPSHNNANSNFTSATVDNPPVVIDLQDTNSSMNSLVSKDVTNASPTFYRKKSSAKKLKKEKKRKERNVVSRPNQSLQDCDDQNTTTTASYHHKRTTSDPLILDEKSHTVYPTISNISEILSLSNSSMSSVFPSTDAISKNLFQSRQSELASSSSAKMSKSDLTFAGKFKQNNSSTSGGCSVLNYTSGDSMNVNILSSNSPNQNKFSLFGGGVGAATTNSNDDSSSSNSRTTRFNIVGEVIKPEASTTKQNIENVLVKQVNEKSLSNMSNKGNSSTDNVFDNNANSTITATQQHQQQQQQQSIDLTIMDFSSQQTVKQPKKRGRKKGSKGVDAVIAKDTSLSSQMLISSLSVAGKKVKTTKELYAEMENRKLRNNKLGETAGNSSANWITQQQQQLQPKPVSSRRASFCSDIADSDSCTMTSEPSRDSVNMSNRTLGKRETPLDNNSNYSDLKMSMVKCDEGSSSCSPLTEQNSTVAITAKIKQELQELIKLLAPPAGVKEIEYECFNNITPCTCTIEEVVVKDTNDVKDSSSRGGGGGGVGEISLQDVFTNNTNNAIINENESNNHANIDQIMERNLTEQVKGEDVKDDLKDQAPQQPIAKIKKSIFDLDFDDDEDPLNSIIADIVGKTSKGDLTELKTTTTTSPVVMEEKPNIPPLSHEDDQLSKVDHLNAQYALNVPNAPAVDLIDFPSYEVHYDLECAAKNRFELQTQKITKFHIDTLHNCFIPNVNGNWNNAEFISKLTPVKVLVNNNKDLQHPNDDLIIDGYDVVPLYGTDLNEQIVKDLSHVQFSHKLNNKHINCKNEILFQIPFLGASRVTEAKGCINLQEEEKENYDKLNLKNICNKSALATVEFTKINALLAKEDEACDDAKEREVSGRVQNLVNSSNIRNLKIKKILNKIKLKRSKRNNASQLEKEYTNKRLKLQVNNVTNLEASSDNTTTSHTTNYYCVDVKQRVAAGETDSDTDLDYEEQDHNYCSETETHKLNTRSPELHEQKPDDVANELQHEVVVNHPDVTDSKALDHHIVLTIQKSSGSKINSPLNTLQNLSSVKQNFKDNLKLHNRLFFHEELCPLSWNGSHYHNECIFHISSCSSGCTSDEETTTSPPPLSVTASASPTHCSAHKYEDHVMNQTQMQTEFEMECKNFINYENAAANNCFNKAKDNGANNEDDEIEDDDLPEENNHMLLSFNNICHKYTREENAKQFKQQQDEENKDPENKLLKQQQQFQNCDDYNNLNNNNNNNNFNLIKYIDNKTSSINNINHINNNNNTNSCSNNYSDANIISSSSSRSSSSSSTHENQTNNVKLQQQLNTNLNLHNKPLIEYQTGLRTVDEDVNDSEGNSCGRLQQFKEWHQVLKLHSYNNELLTVLPYVVLE